jgi:hypothetical protein
MCGKYKYYVSVEFVGCNHKVSPRGHVCNSSVSNGISYKVYAYAPNVIGTKFHLRISIIFYYSHDI